MPGYWVGFAWLYKTSISKSDTFYKHSAWLRGWLCLAFEGFYNGSVLSTFCFPQGGGARTNCAHVIIHKRKSDTLVLAVTVVFVEHLALVIMVSGGTVFPLPLFSGGGNDGSSQHAQIDERRCAALRGAAPRRAAPRRAALRTPNLMCSSKCL